MPHYKKVEDGRLHTGYTVSAVKVFDIEFSVDTSSERLLAADVG